MSKIKFFKNIDENDEEKKWRIIMYCLSGFFILLFVISIIHILCTPYGSIYLLLGGIEMEKRRQRHRHHHKRNHGARLSIW